MIEYIIFDKDYSPITRDNYQDISKAITNVLPGMPLEVNKTQGFIRESRGRNGEAVHTYYRNRDIRIFTPDKDNELLKEKFEAITGLKLEKRKCQ